MKTNKKELLAEIDRLKCENKSLQRLVDLNNIKIEEIENSPNSTPTDCKPGELCKACAFGRIVYVRDYDLNWKPIYVCGKNNACPNFIQKKPEEIPV